MKEIAVNLSIAGRKYPMKVSIEEERRIRQIGKLINQQLEEYQTQLGLQDKQDLLAMVTFDIYMQYFKLQDTQAQAIDKISSLVQEIHKKNESH